MVSLYIKKGIIRIRRYKKMLLIFYLANLFASILLTLPFKVMLENFVDKSLLGRDLAGSIDMDFLFEFLKYNPNLKSIMLLLLPIVALGYWAINLWLSGGALALLVKDKEYTTRYFLSNAAGYLGRFVRLSLWCVPLIILLFYLPTFEKGIEWLIFREQTQYIAYWGNLIRGLLRFLMLAFFFTILDYARIYMIMTDEQQGYIAIREALNFIAANFSKAFLLMITFFGINILGLICYNFLADLLTMPNIFVVILLFILQQLFIVGRMILKLSLYSSETLLFQKSDSQIR